jgi:crossover junction endodeoxyribonuclease RuvC
VNVAGIDPGLSVALAVLNESGVVPVEDLPIYQLPSSKRLRPELDLATLRQLLCARAIDHVVIEQVAARSGQGTVSMFRFGFCAGPISGLVVGLQLPYTFVLPKTRQRAVDIGPSPDQARQRAAQLYPQSAPQLSRKRDGGRADAILIARHGLRLMDQPRGIAAE